MYKGALTDLDVGELRKLIHDREVSAADLVQQCLNRIEESQESTNAFVAIRAEWGLEQAQAYDMQAANGQFAGPLHGIPVAVKDNYYTADFPTTACSEVHKGKPNGTDSTVVSKLRAAGAVIIGKTNMHEWAYGATNEVSSFGKACNPWNDDHITGGSSGGSGAALAARMVPAALGSDTGGSVRIPSSACGVSGLKPTFGRVSRAGILPLSWSLDTAGPMARSARDLGLLLKVMSGEDSKDPTTRGINPYSQVERLGHRVRIAILRSDEIACDSAVAAANEEALKILEEDGAMIDEVTIPGLSTGFGAWKIILHSEAATYHAQFLSECPEKYSDNVRVQIEAGRCLSASSYLKAQQYRTLLNQKISAILECHDMIAMPTLPVTAPRIGEHMLKINGSSITSQDAMTSIAWIANSCGLPAISIPCGHDDAGLPIGLMLVGAAFQESQIIAVADRFQNLTNWHEMKPA